MPGKFKRAKEWIKRKSRSVKEWFKEKPWGDFIATGLAFITVGGFVVGISYASGGIALVGFVALWVAECIITSKYELELFTYSRSGLITLIEFYKSVGRAIYNACRSNSADEQESLLSINNSSIDESSLSFSNEDIKNVDLASTEDIMRTLRQHPELQEKVQQLLNHPDEIRKLIEEAELKIEQSLPTPRPLSEIISPDEIAINDGSEEQSEPEDFKP